MQRRRRQSMRGKSSVVNSEGEAEAASRCQSLLIQADHRLLPQERLVQGDKERVSVHLNHAPVHSPAIWQKKWRWAKKLAVGFDPTAALCLGTYGDPVGAYEQGTPVAPRTEESGCGFRLLGQHHARF